MPIPAMTWKQKLISDDFKGYGVSFKRETIKIN